MAPAMPTVAIKSKANRAASVSVLALNKYRTKPNSTSSKTN